MDAIQGSEGRQKKKNLPISSTGSILQVSHHTIVVQDWSCALSVIS